MLKTHPRIANRRHTTLLKACVCLPALMWATLAGAQSVAPDTPQQSTAGGPLAGQSPPGVRPPKSQKKPAEALPGGQAGPANTPQSIRWTEDWSKPPADDASFLDQMRHIALGTNPDFYLSLGGEERIYYTNWHHSTLGLRANDDNAPTQSRLRLIADLHLGPYVRTYLELGDNREFEWTTKTPPNRDQMDIYQAFVDLTAPLGDDGKITVRPGRFEMPLGNGKLMGVREGLNMRFTYQGVRATYILPGEVSVDTFAVRPINIHESSFDDGPNSGTTYKGIYVSAPNRLFGFGTDGYVYEVDRAAGTLREGAGHDNRTNYGARLWRRADGWDFDLEGDYQGGTFANKAIDAYAVLFEGGYTFADTILAPRLGAKANLFSGDGDLKDGTAGTFVAASPRLPLISEAAFFNLSDLMDFYPSLTVKPREDVTIMIGPDFLWRQSMADGVYIGSSGASIAPYSSGRFIGTDLNLEASWQATKNIQFRIFETYFTADSEFAAHGGKSGNYFGVFTDLRF
ncbi:MAG: alginate export family protein [Azospirillaceae bacterium]|nr:alginate export family protein [Azospirillaceae bacterium]